MRDSKCVEMSFRRDTKKRKRYFTPESFAHPAKMDLGLLLWIVGKYTMPGELILDPMAGMGTTMLACILDRDVVLVELEDKFCKMMQDNWEKMRQLGDALGDCQIIQGDAKQLEGLCDKIISSPPYIAQTSTSKQTEGLFKGRQLFKDGRDPQPHSEGQIGDLPYGQIDKIVTSPPFGEAHSQKDLGVGDKDRADLRAYSFLKSNNPSNIGNLPYGQIDKIVTSPPYEEAMGQKHHSPRADKLAKEKSNPVTYTDRVDSIITSPPYEGSLSGIDDEDRAKEFDRMKSRGMRFNPLSHSNVTRGTEYSKAEENIGNLKSQSYLEAMLQVYQQCHKVLKPEGLMILVTKNFIRNKHIVHLDTDTIELCEHAGFKLVDWHFRRLLYQSFWRVIYHQKYPEVPKIEHEDILVFEK